MDGVCEESGAPYRRSDNPAIISFWCNVANSLVCPFADQPFNIDFVASTACCFSFFGFPVWLSFLPRLFASPLWLSFLEYLSVTASSGLLPDCLFCFSFSGCPFSFSFLSISSISPVWLFFLALFVASSRRRSLKSKYPRQLNHAHMHERETTISSHLISAHLLNSSHLSSELVSSHLISSLISHSFLSSHLSSHPMSSQLAFSSHLIPSHCLISPHLLSTLQRLAPPIAPPY